MSNYKMSICVILASVLVALANPSLNTTGVGARSYGMGNNFTALANDFSAVYWNPAGLAFQPVREVAVSVVGLRNSAISELSGQRTSNLSQRVSIGSAGLVRSIPTSRGGFSFAVGYIAPYITDDVFKVVGKDVYLGTDTSKGGYRAPVTYNHLDRLAYGQIGSWTGAMGWQIAPRAAVGISAGVALGSEEKALITDASYPVARTHENSETDLSINYLGYEIRAGLLVQPMEFLSVGVRLDLPRSLWASETETVIVLKTAQSSTASYSYYLQSPATGSLGLALKLPALVVSTDGSIRAPLPVKDASSTLARWKGGAGIGFEIPVKPVSGAIRLGYGWQQFEPVSMTEQGGGSDYTQYTITRDRHLFTAGFSFILSSWAIEAAYGYQIWSFSSSVYDYQNAIAEDHEQHRIVLALSFHY